MSRHHAQILALLCAKYLHCSLFNVERKPVVITLPSFFYSFQNKIVGDEQSHHRQHALSVVPFNYFFLLRPSYSHKSFFEKKNPRVSILVQLISPPPPAPLCCCFCPLLRSKRGESGETTSEEDRAFLPPLIRRRNLIFFFSYKLPVAHFFLFSC